MPGPREILSALKLLNAIKMRYTVNLPSMFVVIPSSFEYDIYLGQILGHYDCLKLLK